MPGEHRADSLNTMRLFAALPLSLEAIERLARLRLRLSAPGDGLRWSTPEQWHITLQFYGEIDEERGVCLREGLAHRTLSSPPEVVLDGLGRFEAKGILYAAVAVTPSLLLLQERVVAFGKACGVVPESRAFRPHVTLARSKGRPRPKTPGHATTPELPPFGAAVRWFGDEVQLIQSTLSPRGAEYTVYSRRSLTADVASPVEA